MFAPYCRHHGARVLLPMSAITALIRGPGGLEVHFVCHCGTVGVWRSGDDVAAVAS